MNRLTNLALVFVACILIFAAAAGGVLLKFHEARLDAADAGAMLDNEDSSVAESVAIEQGSLCKGIFRDPFEKVVFLFRDGTFLVFSTGHEKAVLVPIAWILHFIEESGRDIKDCLLIVHNHFSPMGFSESDLQTYQYLYRKGFRGVFGIYYPSTGKFRGVED